MVRYFPTIQFFLSLINYQLNKKSWSKFIGHYLILKLVSKTFQRLEGCTNLSDFFAVWSKVHPPRIWSSMVWCQLVVSLSSRNYSSLWNIADLLSHNMNDISSLKWYYFFSTCLNYFWLKQFFTFLPYINVVSGFFRHFVVVLIVVSKGFCCCLVCFCPFFHCCSSSNQNDVSSWLMSCDDAIMIHDLVWIMMESVVSMVV